jgi:flagellar biogenesis protein FliO
MEAVFGLIVVIGLIALIVWGYRRMLDVDNRIARGDRTFISDILKAITGKDKQ